MKNKLSINLVAFVFFLAISIIGGIGGLWYYLSAKQLLIAIVDAREDFHMQKIQMQENEKNIAKNNIHIDSLNNDILKNKGIITKLETQIKEKYINKPKHKKSREEAIQYYQSDNKEKQNKIDDINAENNRLKVENAKINKTKFKLKESDRSYIFWSKGLLLFFVGLSIFFLLLIFFNVKPFKFNYKYATLFALPFGGIFITSMLLDFTTNNLFRALEHESDYTWTISSFLIFSIGSSWIILSLPNENQNSKTYQQDLDLINKFYFSKTKLFSGAKLSEELFLRGSVLLDVIRIRDRLLLEQNRIENKASINLLLGVGTTIIALVFLLASPVWWGYDPFKEVGDARWFNFVAYYLPRLGFIIFVELFSFYFLRLYKLGMVEIKFYQNERTNIDMKILSLRVAIAQKVSNGDDTLLRGVIESLKNTERNFVLHKDESTVDIELRKVQDKNDQQYSITKEDFYKMIDLLKNNSKDKNGK